MNNEFEIEGTTLTRYTGKGGSVVVPDSVTTIGEGAFWGCPCWVDLRDRVAEIQNAGIERPMKPQKED